jgi:flagellar biosynthetic protein FlhB
VAEFGEKTEAPTAKRKEEARSRGQVGKSTDLASAIVLTGAVIAMIAVLDGLFRAGFMLMRNGLSADAIGVGSDPQRLGPGSWALLRNGLGPIIPVMITMIGVGYIAHALQVGVMFSTKSLKPKLDKFNLVSGIKRLFSKRSAVRGVLDLLKLVVVGGVIYLAVRLQMPKIVALGLLTLPQALVEAAYILLIVTIWTLVILFVLGLIDFAYQKWQNKEDLKMTKQEVKDERKSAEGDMEVKRRRLRMAREIAMQRLQRDVPNADVIVTNPTHYSVALRYRASEGAAPRVVAKGADFMALKIRYIAHAHSIAIVERPPLARALYRDVEVGQSVRPEHYEAVAEVLAYVYRLEGRAAEAAAETAGAAA